MDVANAGVNYCVGEPAVRDGLHLRRHDFTRLPGWTFDPAIFGGAVLRRARLRRREVPEEPGDRARRPGGPHAVQQHDQRRGRRLQRPAERRPSCTATSRATWTRPGDQPCNLASRARRPDLLHQRTNADRHAVLPVVRTADAGARASSAPSWWRTSSRAPVAIPGCNAARLRPATSSRAIRRSSGWATRAPWPAASTPIDSPHRLHGRTTDVNGDGVADPGRVHGRCRARCSARRSRRRRCSTTGSCSRSRRTRRTSS